MKRSMTSASGSESKNGDDDKGVSFVKKGFLNSSTCKNKGKKSSTSMETESKKPKKGLTPLQEIAQAWEDGEHLPLSVLPLECVASIFSFCEKLGSAELVCKEWQAYTRAPIVRKTWILGAGSGFQRSIFGRNYNPLCLVDPKDESPFHGNSWRFLLMSRIKVTPSLFSMGIKSIGAIHTTSDTLCDRNAPGRAVVYEGECIDSGGESIAKPHGYGVCYYDTDVKVFGVWETGFLVKGTLIADQGRTRIVFDETIPFGSRSNDCPIICIGKMGSANGEEIASFEGIWVLPNSLSMITHICKLMSQIFRVQGKSTHGSQIWDGMWYSDFMKGTKTDTAKGTFEEFEAEGIPTQLVGITPMRLARHAASTIRRRHAYNIFEAFLGRVVQNDPFEMEEEEEEEDE